MERRHLYWLLILLTACTYGAGINAPDEQVVGARKTLVLSTDSADWYVALFYEGVYIDDALTKTMPAPYRLPTKDEANVLRTLDYPHHERFITSDSNSFCMPSASVTKAGAKTKYSVLGLWKRQTVIIIDF